MTLVCVLSSVSPEWIALEFPADKRYGGGGERIDYFSSMEALKKAKPFRGDVDSLLDFLGEWGNHDIRDFVIAGISLTDCLRAAKGKRPLAAEIMEEVGIRPYHARKDAAGNTLLFDADGQFVGKASKSRPRWARKARREHTAG